MSGPVIVREATEADVLGIRAIFDATYADDYPYRDFYEEGWLKRAVYNDSLLMLVAEDTATGGLLGTASVVFDVSSHSDLTGEFGRLAVPPGARGRGIGRLLMQRRIDFVRGRLHAALVENRTAHAFSQKISERHELACVGFLPNKFQFDERESIALYGLTFEAGLALRRNHPRLIPEAQALAVLSMRRCGLTPDAIVDEDAPPYAAEGGLTAEALTSAGTPALLRIERGRVRRREIFGPIRLQYGFFMLAARQASYVIARDAGGAVAGAIGFVHHPKDGNLRVFELIARSDGVVRFLWDELLQRCRTWDVKYVEADVSAHAPSMQRTLLELGFLPAAYVPAAVFAEVERLDVVRMVRLFCAPPDLDRVALTPHAHATAELVVRAFRQRAVLPRVEAAVGHLPLFEGLTAEQRHRLAGAFSVLEAAEETALYRAGEPARRLFVVLTGRICVEIDGRAVGEVGSGDCLGELSVLTGAPHSATARVCDDVVAAVLTADDLSTLTRARPDIAVLLYRNLALDVGRKLQRVDAALIEGGTVPP